MHSTLMTVVYIVLAIMLATAGVAITARALKGKNISAPPSAPLKPSEPKKLSVGDLVSYRKGWKSFFKRVTWAKAMVVGVSWKRGYAAVRLSNGFSVFTRPAHELVPLGS